MQNNLKIIKKMFSTTGLLYCIMSLGSKKLENLSIIMQKRFIIHVNIIFVLQKFDVLKRDISANNTLFSTDPTVTIDLSKNISTYQ